MSQHAPKRSMFTAGAIKVLLVDEDPLFRSRMQRAAAARGWALTAFAALADVDAGRASKEFDVLVINSYLDEVRHPEGNRAEALGTLPTVLVSNFKTSGEGTPWPATVCHHARKADGCDAILEAASTAAHERGALGGILGKLRSALKR